MFSIRFNRWIVAAFAVTALAIPCSLSAQTPDHPADNSAQFPSNRDLKSLTMSGSYLAARHASVERDANSAAAFYRSALRTDPKNNELLDRAFISSLADGDIDKLTGPEWYPIFKDLHAGMILELGGKDKDAGARLERAYKLDDSMLRVADAYARWLSRNKDAAAATAVYEAFDKKPAMAIKVYERMPASSPLKRNAQIQLATNLDAADRSDEAIKILKGVTAEDGKDIEAVMALGNIERGRKKFADCVQTYSQGIDVLPQGNDKANWIYYYYRGICEERSKQWSKAETDMRKALELQPEQPHVLNYLGYSWIDQGINLDEGMKMIKRAVDQRPDDGYIVDSLGWAYYRIGSYEDAVKNLERAIDLKPEDPTINDHLGDAYWRIGRTLEAKFQWAHARDLKPEPEELPKIEAKMENGLPDDTSSAASADKKKEDGKGG